MGKLEAYRSYIQQIIKRHADRHPPDPTGEVEVQTVFDTTHDHYQLMRVGWRDDSRFLFGCFAHVDIKNGKFWIQYDGTEDGIATELIELGVPQEDIVLGFHAPYKRPYTGFASN